MSIARKCDRCGKCFDPLKEYLSMCRFRNPIFENAASIRENKINAKMFNESSPDMWVDLCPSCTGRFVMFMCDEVERAAEDVHNSEGDMNG